MFTRWLTREAAGKIALLLFGLLLPVLAIEGWERWQYQRWKTRAEHGIARAGQYMQAEDPRLVWKLVPGSEHFDSVIDAHGYRGKQAPPGPRGDHNRVVFVGDSVTFGYDVQDGATFVRKVERLGRALGDGALQTVNLGVPAYSFDQIRAMASDHAPRWSPRTLVYAVCLNDLDSSEHTDARHRLWSPPTSYVWQRLRRLPRQLTSLSHEEFVLQHYGPSVAAGLAALEAESREAGVPLFTQVVPFFPKKMIDFGDYPFTPSHTLFTDLNARGVNVKDTLPAFVRYAFTRPQVAVDDVHPSPLGHSIVAAEVLARLYHAGRTLWAPPVRELAATLSEDELASMLFGVLRVAPPRQRAISLEVIPPDTWMAGAPADTSDVLMLAPPAVACAQEVAGTERLGSSDVVVTRTPNALREALRTRCQVSAAPLVRAALRMHISRPARVLYSVGDDALGASGFWTVEWHRRRSFAWSSRPRASLVLENLVPSETVQVDVWLQALPPDHRATVRAGSVVVEHHGQPGPVRLPGVVADANGRIHVEIESELWRVQDVDPKNREWRKLGVQLGAVRVLRE